MIRSYILFSRSDYLRLEGYAGALDTYYCGQDEKISIKLHKNNPLKMTFKGHERPAEYDTVNRKRILHLLEGFKCEVQCKDSNIPLLNSTESSQIKSTPTPSQEPTTSTATPVTLIPGLKPTVTSTSRYTFRLYYPN